MKFIYTILTVVLTSITALAQNQHSPVEVTPAILKTIKSELSKEAEALKARLKASSEAAIVVEFTLDTFLIEKFQEKYIDYDWSTAGMRLSTYEAAAKYDSLLNKYYKKLSGVLKPTDRLLLVNAQKAWISFRDKEQKLIGIVSKEEYSGGGTIQQLIDAGYYLELVRRRLFQIYQHYSRATQTD